MTLAIAIGALTVAVFAALVSLRQLLEARKANAFPAVITLFSQYREPEMIKARRVLSQGLAEVEDPCAIHDLPDGLAQAAQKVANYLENVGLVMQLGLVEPRVVVGFMGVSAERIWDELAAFIALERKGRPDGLYLEYFEHLAATIRELRPGVVRSELRKVPTRFKYRPVRPLGRYKVVERHGDGSLLLAPESVDEVIAETAERPLTGDEFLDALERLEQRPTS